MGVSVPARPQGMGLDRHRLATALSATKVSVGPQRLLDGSGAPSLTIHAGFRSASASLTGGKGCCGEAGGSD